MKQYIVEITDEALLDMEQLYIERGIGAPPPAVTQWLYEHSASVISVELPETVCQEGQSYSLEELVQKAKDGQQNRIELLKDYVTML